MSFRSNKFTFKLRWHFFFTLPLFPVDSNSWYLSVLEVIMYGSPATRFLLKNCQKIIPNLARVKIGKELDFHLNNKY
jgi:hypothetical protein